VLPYTGISNLWHLRPWADFGRTARGKVRESGDRSGTIEISVVARDDELSTELDDSLERNMADIRACIAAQTPLIESMNVRLPGLVDAAIKKRRARLAVIDAFPVEKQNQDVVAPSQVIELQKVPPAAVEPLRKITDAAYEELLSLIRLYGRGLEQTPKTAAKLEEEDIRNLLLVLLNTHYPASPLTPETFRRKGDADITLTALEKDAFVAECKIWRGPHSLNDAIDQLLNRYVLWRDARCAILMFNTEVKGVSDIVEKIPPLLDEHPLAKSKTASTRQGEWRLAVAPEDDPNASVTLHVFFFNFYVS
jgi:hypothetical protein